MISRIVVFGASTAFGRVDPEGGGFAGRLKRYHESKNKNNALFNLGISGEGTQEMLKRFTNECSPRRPDLIILNTGINDFSRRGSPQAQTKNGTKHRDNLRTLLVAARGLAQVILLTPHQALANQTIKASDAHGDIFYLQEDLQLGYQTALELAEELKIRVLDLVSLFANQPIDTWCDKDLLHLNAQGHEQVFKEIQKFL